MSNGRRFRRLKLKLVKEIAEEVWKEAKSENIVKCRAV